MLVAFLLVISCLPPLCDSLTVEDQDVEERIEQEDDLRLDGYAVEEDGLRRNVGAIRHKCGLNHDQGVVNILLIQYMSRTFGQSYARLVDRT